MAFRSQLNKAYPQQRRLRQVKRTYETANRLFSLLLIRSIELHGKLHILVNPLRCFTSHHFEPGAQHFMPLHKFTERCFEPGSVQSTLQQHRFRHIVAKLRAFQLIQDKETLLSKRLRVNLSIIRHRNGNEYLLIQPRNGGRHALDGGMAEHIAQR